MTTYPISKIRSGEVAVKLTSLEQYEKLDPSEKVSFFRKDKYYAFINGKLNDVHNWNITCDFSQIDWEEGKKETVEEAIKREYEARKFNSDFPFEPQSFKIGAKWQKEQLDKELSSLKAENDRLKEEIGMLKNSKYPRREVTELENTFQWYEVFKEKLASYGASENTTTVDAINACVETSKLYCELMENTMLNSMDLEVERIKNEHSQPQELTLKQRMAWELYVAGFNHGIADKWTIAECYRSASIFINYKGGDDEQ